MGVLRKIARLAKEVPVANRAVDAWQLKALYAAMPGLYEWLWGEAPPASGDQDCIGHDHSLSSTAGGVSIPRNCILEAGFGSGDNYMWELASNAEAGWTPADDDYSPSRSDLLGYHWKPYVDIGLDTASHAALYAEAWLALACNGSTDIRITNVTAGSASNTASYTGGGAIIEWVRIPNLPVSDDEFNELLLEYDVSEELQVYTYGIIVAEVYRGGAVAYTKHSVPLTQPPISGEVS